MAVAAAVNDFGCGEMRVRPKTPNLDDRMLDAAARLFGAKRFHEVRMDDIAAEASVSKGTLYRYFRDKDEMYLALLSRASGQVIRLLRERVAQAETARDKLIALVGSVIVYFDANPHLFDLIQRAEALRGPGGDFPWQPVREEGIRLVGRIFRQAKRRGEFVIRDKEVAGLMLLGGMRAVVRFGKRPRRAGLVERVVDTILRGAARRARTAV